MMSRGLGRMVLVSDRADEVRPEVEGHDVEPLAVCCGDVTIAVELHRLGGSGRALVCFIPGGTTDPSRTRPITSPWERQQLRALALIGCDGLTLNFPGVGQSSGNLADNTLERRGEWIEAVLHAAAASQRRGPLILVGCSMGAHVAALLTRRMAISGLALVAPAAYGSNAVDKHFGASFAAEIRRAGSWHSSPAFAALTHYAGPVLLLLPERDGVIPRLVTASYEAAAGPGSDIVWLRGATHQMLSSDRPEDHRARDVTCDHVAQLATRARAHAETLPQLPT